MKIAFGVAPTRITYEETLDQAVSAEKYGFDSVWLGEHHVTGSPFLQPLIGLAGVALHTRRIRIGSSILLLPLHHPLHVAEDAAILDVISGGRLILGVGIGYRKEEFQAFQVPFKERARIFEEQIEIIRSLWSEPRVTHTGRYFNFTDVSVNPQPIQKPLPIWIGTGALTPDEAIRRAARLADAWIPEEAGSYHSLRISYDTYRAFLKQYGKNSSTIEFPLRREMFISKDSDTARKEAETYAQPAYVRMASRGWPSLVAELGKTDFTFEELQKDRFIIGDPDQCISLIEEYHKDIGANHFIMRFSYGGMPQKKVLDAMALFGSKVIPYFK